MIVFIIITTILTLAIAIINLPFIQDKMIAQFSGIRFVCLNIREKEVGLDINGMSLKSIFDITIVNKSRVTKYFSHVSIQMKNNWESYPVFLNPFIVNLLFTNKLEAGQSMKEFIICKDTFEKDKLNFKHFDRYRILIEESSGKKHKSKWYKTETSFFLNTVKWTLSEKV